jgi:hypothetical protein
MKFDQPVQDDKNVQYFIVMILRGACPDLLINQNKALLT